MGISVKLTETEKYDLLELETKEELDLDRAEQVAKNIKELQEKLDSLKLQGGKILVKGFNDPDDNYLNYIVAAKIKNVYGVQAVLDDTAPPEPGFDTFIVVNSFDPYTQQGYTFKVEKQ